MTTVLTAYIDEQNCIGCGKCIRVCPTDAIVGARHLLHTVIPQYCTSCENCINVCPTNCIILQTPSIAMSKYAENQLKMKKQIRLTAKPLLEVKPATKSAVTADIRKQQVADAIARAKARRNQAQ